ncbi:MAG: hypothetical protein KBF21_10425 [Thermoanaerobaculia bacterium]|nr:hypothetical protein [Thermoanaerobaculia bacterium]MBP9824627.1 hypothetical protein [Thermoanaerobaculia bacterium]
MNRCIALSLGLSLALSTISPAQPLPIGGEVTVNATVAGEQTSPDIAADGADNFRIVWSTQVGDPAHWDVRIRRLQVNGSLGSDSLLSETTTLDQKSPSVDSTAGGDWVASWSTDQAAVGVDLPFGRWTTAGGTILGAESQFAVDLPADISFPAVAAVGDDSFVGVWRNESDGNSIEGRFRDRSGVQFAGSAIAASAPGSAPDAAGLYGDQWVAVWHASDGQGSGAYFRCHELALALEPGTIAHAVVTGDQTFPAVASDGQFRFVIVWQHELEIRARLFTIDGGGTDCAPIGNEFTVSTPGEPAAFPRVDMAADGAFVVVWYSQEFDADNGIAAREYTKVGLPAGAPFAVNATTLGVQANPAVAISAGTFGAVWTTPDSGAAGPRNIVVRRFARRVVFTDGFESLDFTAWSAVTP